MSRGLRLGGRVFVPSAGFTVVALVLCALCVRLGAWQWHKGMQREQEWTRFARGADQVIALGARAKDRKSTRLNSSHRCISYAVFCLKKKTVTDCQKAAQLHAAQGNHANYDLARHAQLKTR